MVPAENQVQRYAARALEAHERRHPLAESGWKAVGHSTFEGEPETLLLERHGQHRLIELYEDYAWVSEKRALAWAEFIALETTSGDRVGWVAAILEQLAVFGHAVPNPKVWVAEHPEHAADWLLGLEF